MPHTHFLHGLFPIYKIESLADLNFGMDAQIKYTNVGVPQESCHGPLLFITNINDPLKAIHNSAVFPYITHAVGTPMKTHALLIALSFLALERWYQPLSYKTMLVGKSNFFVTSTSTFVSIDFTPRVAMKFASSNNVLREER